MSWAPRLRLSTWATIIVFVLIYAACAMQFPLMASPRVAANLLNDSAYLGILAIGMTVVVVSGGIDLSVGAVMAFTSMLIAVLVAQSGWHPLAAFGAAFAIATVFGAGVGAAIHFLQAPPFIATLTAMFLARGGAILLNNDSVPVRHELYGALTSISLSLPGGGRLSLLAMVMIAAMIFGGLLLHRTRFGANVFALGGDARAARLMGANVGRTTILIYAFSGAMAALAGVVFSLYTQAGYSLAAIGLELDVIAAVVIGGAALAGGAGSMLGSFFGMLIGALIQTYVTFEGTLSSWWVKIAIGALIFAFILMQTLAGRGGVSAISAASARGKA